MSSNDRKKTREDEFGSLTVVFTADGRTIVTDSTGHETYLFKKFPRTEEGLDQALAYFIAVKEMTEMTILAMDFEENRVTIH